jgi:hypothetical protein
LYTVFLAQGECSLRSRPTKHQKWAQQGRQLRSSHLYQQEKEKKHHGRYKSPGMGHKAVFLLIPVTARHFWYVSNPFLRNHPKQNICRLLANPPFPPCESGTRILSRQSPSGISFPSAIFSGSQAAGMDIPVVQKRSHP